MQLCCTYLPNTDQLCYIRLLSLIVRAYAKTKNSVVKRWKKHKIKLKGEIALKNNKN